MLLASAGVCVAVSRHHLAAEYVHGVANAWVGQDLGRLRVRMFKRFKLTKTLVSLCKLSGIEVLSRIGLQTVLPTP